MGKANNQPNKSKPKVSVSIGRLLMVLIGANFIMLLAPNFGMLNSFLYIPDLYTWPAFVLGFVLIFFGFKGLYKKP
uniref:DUF5668 domain-containing protein n=1 Tax=Chlorobium chlorochromatii (strain CaD3) TaxID=340177 RepID=Q3AUD7_CHLCH